MLHLPPGTAAVAAVIMLHGAGGSADFAVAETGWSAWADREGFAVVFPEGMALNPDRASKFLTNPQEWNDGSGRGQHDDVGFLDAVLDNLPDRVDRRRLCLTGFSNGAGMAFRYAAERPARMAVLAPVAGHCWLEPRPNRLIPTLYLVGDADPLVPLRGGEVRTLWGYKEQRPAVAETWRRWGEAIGRVPGAPDFPCTVIPGQGHHWPGGRALLGEKLGGPVTHAVCANAAIWSFFINNS